MKWTVTEANDRVRLACRLAVEVALACVALPVAAETGERVRLIPERDAVVPGTTFSLAVELQMRPGWHTYWLNPGDSGLAPTLRWRLPDGVRLARVWFPVPERIEEAGMVTFGYTDRVWLLVDFVTDEKLAGAKRVEVGLTVDWMVCLEMCMPLQGEASVSLGVVASEPAPAADETAAAFAHWRAKLPKPADGWVVQAQAERGGLKLRIQPPDGIALTDAAWDRAQFCVTRNGALDLQAVPRWRRRGAAWSALLRAGPDPFKTGDVIDGILVFPAEGSRNQAVVHAWAIRATVSRAP
jgi:thiol:disulfide interchange protein DsbD